MAYLQTVAALVKQFLPLMFFCCAHMHLAALEKIKLYV
jgi:hypothetical protein